MSSKTEPTLLERLRDGADTVAWEEFFERYGRLIYAHARHRGCSDNTAEEIVQEVMLKVFDKRDLFRYDPSRGRFRDWLAAVVRNHVAQFRRRPAERIRALGGDGDGPLALARSEEGEPDAAWEAAFDEALLVALLDVVRHQINPRTYQAFELFVVRELPACEVARLTGLTRNAVYQARKNVLRRLRDLGETYRRDGPLTDRIKRAMRSGPGAAMEQSLAERIAGTVQSR